MWVCSWQYVVLAALALNGENKTWSQAKCFRFHLQSSFTLLWRVGDKSSAGSFVNVPRSFRTFPRALESCFWISLHWSKAVFAFSSAIQITMNVTLRLPFGAPLWWHFPWPCVVCWHPPIPVFSRQPHPIHAAVCTWDIPNRIQSLPLQIQGCTRQTPRESVHHTLKFYSSKSERGSP